MGAVAPAHRPHAFRATCSVVRSRKEDLIHHVLGNICACNFLYKVGSHLFNDALALLVMWIKSLEVNILNMKISEQF